MSFSSRPSRQAPDNRTPFIISAVAAVIAVAATVATIVILSNDPEPSASDQPRAEATSENQLTTEPELPTDDQQIRTVIEGLQAAFNRNDFDAYKEYRCQLDREELTEEGFVESRIVNGAIEASVKSVDVAGDKATAVVEISYERNNRSKTDNYFFAREGGQWRWCDFSGWW